MNYQNDLQTIERRISELQRKVDGFERDEQQLKPRLEKAKKLVTEGQNELERLQIATRKIQESIQQSQRDVRSITDDQLRILNEKTRIVTQIASQNKEMERVQRMVDEEVRRSALKK
jgi:chromosome segregation ATPase